MNTILKTAICCGFITLLNQAAPLQFVSHAGNAKSAPPHTIPAYQVAVEQKADFLKLDMHMTKDGVIVLSHDGDFKRTMGMDMVISKLTYQEIYDQGTYKKRGKFDKEKVVRLEQALDMVKDTSLNIWMDPKGFSPRLVDTALAMMAERGIGKERIMLATFSVGAVKYMQKKHPEIRRVLHVSITKQDDGISISFEPKTVRFKPEEVLPKLLEKAEQLKLHGFNFPVASPLFSRESVQFLKGKGYWVSLWFVQDEALARKAVEFGADAVVTDNLLVVQPTARALENKEK